MDHREHGFSMLELLAALLIMGIVAAFAIPAAITAVKGYRLHADASALAGFLNVARMKAASQYAPYRVAFNTAAGQYSIEQLCGWNNSDPGCTAMGATAYSSLATPAIDHKVGVQYMSAGDSLLSCRPAGVPAPSPAHPSPGSITADAAGCPATLYFYFNTRGSPVDNTGNPLNNGGVVVFLQNQAQLLDAITVSVGGRVAVWNYAPSTTTWAMR